MRRSIRFKIGALLLLIALILSATAVGVSYTVYKNTMEDQFKNMTENLAHTEAVTLDKEAVSKLTKDVMDVYYAEVKKNGGNIDFDNMSEEDTELYFSQFDAITKTDEWKTVHTMLRNIADENDVASIYIIDMDLKTERAVYICDASKEEACLPGTTDAIEEGNRKLMVEENSYDFPAYITNYEEYGWLCTAAAGIYDSNNHIVADAYVDISMDYVVANRISFLKSLATILLIITLVASAIFIFVVDRNIVRPIKRLASVAKSFVNDNYSGDNNTQGSDLTIKSKDEIGDLYASVDKMRVDIHDYMENLTAVTAEKERIGAELDVANHIQKSMLPCIFPAFPDRKEFDIYATMNPAKEVGGDFYDFFMVDDRHLAIVMADVSGKGVPAALFMVIGKTLIKDHTVPDADLGQVFTRVNNLLCQSNSEGLFITAFEGVLDLVTGEFTFVNAGHEMPYICHKNGDFEFHKIKAAFVLAGMEGIKYQAGTFQLDEGDKIFQYTDGVTEATNANNELYGMDRLTAILNKVKDKTPYEILPAVKEDIDKFVGEAPQFDDITMLSVEYKAKMEEKE